LNVLVKARVAAVRKAVEFIEDAAVIGVGTGSTMSLFIEVLEGLGTALRDRVFTASSIDTALKLSRAGFRVADPVSLGWVDVYFDSADEVDNDLNMVKGGGAAMTMEKVLAYFSKRRVFIVDYEKLVKQVPERHPVPIEVIPKALAMVINHLSRRGYVAKVRYSAGGKYGPVTSDTGGVIVDVIPPKGLKPREVEDELLRIPGVVETGLFIGLADVMIVGYRDGARVLRRGEGVYHNSLP